MCVCVCVAYLLQICIQLFVVTLCPASHIKRLLCVCGTSACVRTCSVLCKLTRYSMRVCVCPTNYLTHLHYVVVWAPDTTAEWVVFVHAKWVTTTRRDAALHAYLLSIRAGRIRVFWKKMCVGVDHCTDLRRSTSSTHPPLTIATNTAT